MHATQQPALNAAVVFYGVLGCPPPPPPRLLLNQALVAAGLRILLGMVGWRTASPRRKPIRDIFELA